MREGEEGREEEKEKEREGGGKKRKKKGGRERERHFSYPFVSHFEPQWSGYILCFLAFVVSGKMRQIYNPTCLISIQMSLSFLDFTHALMTFFFF